MIALLWIVAAGLVLTATATLVVRGRRRGSCSARRAAASVSITRRTWITWGS